ncbi:hypothetical protein ANN_27831 [Periplaneta americana]|uniref:Uncharacterized protein n=1 Tax=Periplaneta americana TaxID=6978 RepID=A0ABQ8RVC9_PERAM|nr:hypothetical protein ANN_27831 [Periplaneta americana]
MWCVLQEGNSLDLHLTEIKTEYMDHSYDLKSEMTFDETRVPIDFPIVKRENEVEARELNEMKEEVKLEVTAEDDEVLTESIGEPVYRNSIAEDKCLQTEQHKLKCDDRGKRFFDLAKLKFKRPFICDVCGKSYLNSDHLKRHIRVHTGEKPFVCDMCGMKFSVSCNLKRHALLHTGQKPFNCDLCGKKFCKSSDLKDHARVHTGEKPFSCEICGQKFSKLIHRKRHEAVHTGEKPYSCDVCGKKFSQPDSGDEDCKDSDRAQLQAAAELVTELLDIVQPYNEEGGTDIRKDSDLISNEIENSPPPTRKIKRDRNKDKKSLETEKEDITGVRPRPYEERHGVLTLLQASHGQDKQDPQPAHQADAQQPTLSQGQTRQIVIYGVYRIPCSCGSVYIGTTQRSFKTRISEHRRNCCLGHVDKSAAAEHAYLEGEHKIRFEDTDTLSDTTHFYARLHREAIEIYKHKNNFNRKEEGLKVNKAWYPALRKTNIKPARVAQSNNTTRTRIA